MSNCIKITALSKTKLYSDVIKELESAWEEEYFSNPNYSTDLNLMLVEKEFYEESLIDYTEEEVKTILELMGY